ncbi:MAG: DUF1549 domain-containing protein, partial [Planctomycetota bacterium]|nr:DUF1549 domain-containing protein [Planctomycetota bacterium]
MRISLGVALLIAPASFAAQEDAPHWSLRPLVEPDVPQLEGWGRNRVDGFVAEALARQGLSPSPEADRATLIRRLTFDLWGLPPTRAEVDAFLADDRSDAYGRLVDRLLASRHYAERQAQHWLDVARYGDTHGFDKDKRRPHAWRYRDWVVDAFDRDLTWAEFLARQLAGDVLDPGGPDVAGTGFLAAGPWDFVGHVELREGTVDKALTRHLDRDEVAGAVLAAFASTTVSCARCHDHKFDPIPIAEYYALQSVFAGIERADVAFDADPDAARMRRLLEAEVAARRAEITRYEADLAGVSSPEIELLDERLAGVERQRLPAQWTTSTLAEGGGRRLGYHSQIAPSPDVAKWVQVDLGASLFFDEVALWPSNETFGLWEGAGFGFPVRFSVLVGDAPDLSDARVLFSLREQDLPNHGDTPFVVTGDGQAARYVRVVVHKLWGRATAGSTDYCF